MKIKELEDAFCAASHTAGHSRNTRSRYLGTVMDFARMMLAGSIEGPQGYFDHLANDRKLSNDSVRHALNPLKFLYEKVLQREFGEFDVPKKNKNRRMPSFLSQEDVIRILLYLPRIEQLQAGLLAGSGLRVESDMLRIRLKDIHRSTGMLMIQEGKCDKSRAVRLPQAMMPALDVQIAACRRQWEKDHAAGIICPPLAEGLLKKYGRRTFGTLPWYWLFPSRVYHQTENGGERWHSSTKRLETSLKQAQADLGILQRVHPHALRHSYAHGLLQAGEDIRTIQKQLGHADVKTTEIYTEVAGQRGATSPLDRPVLPKVLEHNIISLPINPQRRHA